MKRSISQGVILTTLLFMVFFGLCVSTPASAAGNSDVEEFVTRYYELCLGRSPDSVGLDGWVNELLNGTSTGSDVANGFVFSTEFINKNTTNEEYLQILYKAFFNRQPDSAGLQGWLDTMQTGAGREDVLNGFIYAAEFAELCEEYGIKAFEGHTTKAQRENVKAFVTRFYQLCLDRDPDAAGLEGWANDLFNKLITGADVANGFIYSQEFINKNTTNDEYLTILYKAFFNRDPDQAGWDVWLSELNGSKDRKEVLDGFIYSAEFSNLCCKYGINAFAGSVTCDGITIDISKTIISGKAVLPGDPPLGRLWLVVDGMDGNIYGAGPSDAGGNFNIETLIPADTDQVLVYAVHPANPNVYTKAYVNISENKELNNLSVSSLSHDNISKAATEEELKIIIELRAKENAESLVEDATGFKLNEFSSEEQAVVEQIKDLMLNEGGSPQFCKYKTNPNITKLVADLIKKNRSPVTRKFFDTFVDSSETLISQVQEAQQYVTDHVMSGNDVYDFLSWDVPFFGQQLGVLRTRAMVDTLNISKAREATISRSDLEAAAGVITNLFGDGAYGNCEEHGLTAAYIASRFSRFKQVARISGKDGHYGIHAFAIACEQDESVWDINELIHKYDESVPVPDGLYSADCMIIDPWAEITKPLTVETVEALEWEFIDQVVKVVLSEPDHTGQSVSHQKGLTKEASSVRYQVESTQYKSLAAKACPIDSETGNVACKPFSIPILYNNTPPIAENKSVTTEQNVPVVISLHGIDEDWHPLTYSIVTQPSKGSLSGTAPDLTYTPDTGYSGPDSFTFKVNDGTTDSIAATVSISVSEPVSEYVIWYTDNVRCWGAPFLLISEREQFNETDYRCNYQGGGIDCTQKLVKTEIQGGFAAWEDASNWICPKITGAHYSYWCGGPRAHWIVSGQELDFRFGNLVCGDLSHVPDVPIPDPHPGM